MSTDEKSLRKWGVFICYRQTDGKEAAQWLHDKLHRVALPVIPDGFSEAPRLDVYFDQTAPAVEDWTKIHRPALQGSKAFLMVCSPGAKHKEGAEDWVHRELEWWIEHRSNAPIIIDPTGEGQRWIPDAIKTRWPNAQQVVLQPKEWESSPDEEREIKEKNTFERIVDGIQRSEMHVRYEDYEREKARSRQLEEQAQKLAHQRIKLRRLSVVLGLLAIAAVILGGFGWWQLLVAREQTELAIKHKLLNDAKEYSGREKSLLAALELEKRGYWKDAEPIFREELKNTPRVFAVLELESEETPIALSTNGRYLATTIKDSTIVRLRDVRNSQIVNSLAPKRPWKSLAIRPGGKLMIACVEGGQVWISDGDCSEVKPTFNTEHAVEEVLFSDDASYLAARVNSSVVYIWDGSSDEAYVLKHEDYVLALDFSPDNKYVATFTHNDEFIMVHELGGYHGRKIHTRANPLDFRATLELLFLLVSPDGKYVAGLSKELLRVWDMDTGDKILEAKHEKDITVSNAKDLLAFDKNGRSLVIATVAGEVTRWSIGASKATATMDHKKIQAKLFDMVQTPDGKYLFAAQQGKKLIIWEETDWVGEYEKVHCSNGGVYAATQHSNGVIRVWGANGYPFFASIEADSVKRFAVSEDHHAVTVMGDDGAVFIWPLNDPRKIQKVEPTEAPLYASGLSSNGNFAALIAGRRQVRLWDIYQASEKVSPYYDSDLDVADIDVSCDGALVRIKGDYCDEDYPDCVWTERRWEVGGKHTWTDGKWNNWDEDEWDDRCLDRTGDQRKARESMPDQLAKANLCNRVSVDKMPRKALIDEARRHITQNYTPQEWTFYFGKEPYSPTVSGLPNVE